MKSIGGANLERLCEHPNFNSVRLASPYMMGHCSEFAAKKQKKNNVN